MRQEAWNFWVWSAFNERIYSDYINNDDVTKEGVTEFYEELLRIRDENIYKYEVPEGARECIRVNKRGITYLMPAFFADEMPLKIEKSFKCQIKPSDKRIYHYVQGVATSSIRGESYDRSFREFVDSWNPMEHTEPKHWTFLKLLSIASIIKPLKVAICSQPNMGKNANWTLIGKMLNNVGRFGTPTLAVFERSLYYNQVTLIDEITSISPAQMRELEPIILTVSDNSPDYRKHSLSVKSFLNKVDLGETSIVFPYNRKEDVEKTEGVFFDDVWNNLPAFRSRIPQLLLKGKVMTHMPQLNKAEARKIMEDNFEDMRKIVKQLVYWKENLHKHLSGYEVRINLSNRHLTNLQSLIDVLDVYSEDQKEFDEWIDLLRTAMRDYRRQLDLPADGHENLFLGEEAVN